VKQSLCRDVNVDVTGGQEIANSYMDKQQEMMEMGDVIIKGREKATSSLVEKRKAEKARTESAL
jgi:hypothetical protein